MTQNVIIYIFILLVSAAVSHVFGQAVDPNKPVLVRGEVTAVSSDSATLDANGKSVKAQFSEKTEYKKLPADLNLKAATASSLADIKVGDKLIVSCLIQADGGCNAIRSYQMSTAELSAKEAKEAAEWKTRGIYGKVESIDAVRLTITIKVSGLMSSQSVVMSFKPKAEFLHYANDSVQFADAKPSNFLEIEVGDMVKAVGDRGADNTTFAAEKVLIGSFRTIAGTIKSVDAGKNEVVISDFATGKDVTISTAKVTTFKRFPAEDAERLAGMQAAMRGGMAGQNGGTPPAGGRPQGGRENAGGRPGGQQGWQRPGGAGPRGGVDEMLDRFPTITTADLKPGESIAVSSTKPSATGNVTAFKLLAGVEPFLRLAQTDSGQGRRERGLDGSFTIPGLDGSGF
ncbi:MAG: hypothetical protein UZ17_ACD001000811 [Acidobacteria bacterium OLB17]|nr:MAG: hypothetical protein UZ17_ACD001000811 [Acidobacteria bacterium OLB17]MCZ2389739.1 DUF5666 domain-containing protein [Acidobacteriota bacterium]